MFKRILVIGFGLINCWLLYLVLQSRQLKGAGAAQADMETFLFLVWLGGLVVSGSLLILLVVFLTNIKAVKLSAALVRNPIVIGSVLNIAAPIFLYFYLLAR